MKGGTDIWKDLLMSVREEQKAILTKHLTNTAALSASLRDLVGQPQGPSVIHPCTERVATGHKQSLS